jgi:signal transduction histidine kinase
MPLRVPSPTNRLLAGLAVTLATVGLFSLYTLHQIAGLRDLQTRIIDRNRKDSLQLLRIHRDLHSLEMAMRDMLAGDEPYPLDAWAGQFQRIRTDLDDALRLEAALAPAARAADRQQYISTAVAQFWTTADQLFAISRRDRAAARELLRTSLQAQQAALTSAVARLLVENNDAEQQAATQVQKIYDRVERQAWIFLTALIVTILAITLYLIRANRQIFNRIEEISEHRSELARRLITIQEEILHSLSRELHDEFGQFLTAIGAMLRRLDRRLPPEAAAHEDIAELLETAQTMLDKVRSLSQVLHPAVLDDAGLEKAIDWYVPLFERQTGIEIDYKKTGSSPEIPDRVAINVYRVVQEALNNLAKHSGSPRAVVRVDFKPDRLHVEIQDDGVGIAPDRFRSHHGTGLIAMRERAELLNGAIEFVRPGEKGTLVRLDVPLTEEQSNGR